MSQSIRKHQQNLHSDSKTIRAFLAPQIRMFLLFAFFLSCVSGCAFPSSKEANSAVRSGQLVLQPTPASRQLYVAIGASDTFGQGTDDPITESWPADLTNLLGHDTRMVNLGIPGIDAHQALSVELPVALDARPNLVTVWLAVNDLVDQVPLNSYQQDLGQLLKELRAALPHAQIAVANVPDLSYLPRFQHSNHQQLEAEIKAYNMVIATLVTRYQVQLVDLYQLANQLALHPEYISSDGFHPNALGYTLLSEIFYQVLQKS